MIPSLVLERDPLARHVSETETLNNKQIVFAAVLVNKMPALTENFIKVKNRATHPRELSGLRFCLRPSVCSGKTATLLLEKTPSYLLLRFETAATGYNFRAAFTLMRFEGQQRCCIFSTRLIFPGKVLPSSFSQ
jgi:putative SOS response-associated peptidase YedK